jgi:hypothetical protein
MFGYKEAYVSWPLFSNVVDCGSPTGDRWHEGSLQRPKLPIERALPKVGRVSPKERHV